MVFNNSILLGAAGQGGAPTFDPTLIGNSIWLDGQGTSGDAMTRTWGSQSNQDRWIWATWFQPLRLADATANRNAIFASGSGSHGFYLIHTSTDSSFNIFHRDNSGNEGAINTTESYRDLTAWIHVLVDYDSANANAEDRISLYVNGLRTGVNSGTRPGQNNDLQVNVSGQTAHIAQDSSTTPNYHMKGYLAQTVFLDNKSIANSDLAITDFLDTFTFGTNGSQIVPKSNTDIIALASAAGANSFCLDYSNSSNIVNDASSKGNNFTPTGGGSPTITSANQSTHTPSRTYLQLNPLQKFGTADLSEGNTRVGVDVSDSIRGTKFATTGKKYLEVTLNTVNNSYIGVANGSHNPTSFASSNVACLQKDGDIYINDSPLGSGRSKTFTTGDVVGILIDADAKKFWQSVNGTFNSLDRNTSITLSASDILAGTGGFDLSGLTGDDGNYVLHIGNSDGTSADVSINGGHKAFSHTPPTGYTGWASDDYTAPDFQGIDYFDATIYEGNGTGQRVGDFVPVTDVGTITKSFLCDGHTNSGTTDLTIAHTVSTSPTNTQVKTLSFWIKPVSVREQHVYNGSVGASDSTDSSERIYISTNGEVAYQTRQSGSAVAIAYTAGARINDSSQWFNVVVALNYDSATAAANTLKIYVDGVEQTLFSGAGGTGTAGGTLPAPGMTTEAYINKASTRQLIGTHPGFTSANSRSNCYLAEMYMVDGQALDASAFGVLDTSTNRWVPKAPATIKSTITGTGAGFGGCGFYLDFLDASDLGDDDSGNSTPRDFTESATIGTKNQVADVPSKNYAVYDTVKGAVHTAMSLSEGNLTTKDGNGSVALAAGFPIQDGYWYYEVNTIEDVNNMVFGLFNPATTVTGSTSNPSLSGIQVTGGTLIMQNNGGSNSTAGPTLSNPSAGDVVGIYIRKVKNSYGMWFSLNGTAMSNTPAATETATPDISFAATIELVPAVHYGNPGTKEAQTNFGQLLQFDGGATSFNAASDGYWKHAPVTGFKALNQDNLDDTASKLTAWAWIKNRDRAYPNAEDYVIVDRVRGVTKVLQSNDSSNPAQTTEPNTVQRFLQRGVQVGSETNVNRSGDGHVLWQWLVGDSATTGSTLTGGSPDITSTGIVADAGHFSVGVYEGSGQDDDDISHGLGGTIEMLWVKHFAADTDDWMVWHKDLSSNSHQLHLNTTDDEDTTKNAWGSNPVFDANVFRVGVTDETNKNSTGNSHVFYAFRSVPGVCKIGSYIGNGSTDGPYISTGFKPRWVIYRVIDSGTNAYSWTVVDTARSPINGPLSQVLHPNADSADSTTSGNTIDILSDGWKRRDSHASVNQSGKEYIYMAMADIGGNGTLPPIYGR